jgi:cysteine desulfurase/selenocysteine lyase
LLVDAAQLAPSTYVDVRQLDVDYLAFSFHKIFAPFGVGVLYGKEHLLEASLPFQYGGDMIAEGQVSPSHVEYNDLPWKFAAGTPNIVGVILSAQALRLIVDLTGDSGGAGYYQNDTPLSAAVVNTSMDRINQHTARLTAEALSRITSIPGVTVYGSADAAHRSPLVAFNVAGWNPFELASALDEMGIEARAGCHCATLAHHALGLDPPASCRLSFAVYNTIEDVETAMDAVEKLASSR